MNKFKIKVFLAVLSCLIPFFATGQVVKQDTIRLFFLGGQSNMDGFGYNTDLEDTYSETFKNVWIFHGNPSPDESLDGGLGKWDLLKPGHGTGFSSNGIKNELSNRFGIELSFAKKLQALYPNEKIAFIKYSRSGTAIDSLAIGQFGSWEADYTGINGINQYDHCLKTLKEAFKNQDIDGNGVTDILIPNGIIWMQGESDASFTEEIANRYYFNLKRLMDLLRAAFRTDDLPVVLGKISDSGRDKSGRVWKYGELVQYAQEKYVSTDKNAAIVRSTAQYQYSDTWHYDSNGYIDLGEKFAEAIYLFNKK